MVDAVGVGHGGGEIRPSEHVGADEVEMGIMAEGRDIGFVAGAEVVHRDHLITAVQVVFHHVRTNKTCASSD